MCLFQVDPSNIIVNVVSCSVYYFHNITLSSSLVILALLQMYHSSRILFNLLQVNTYSFDPLFFYMSTYF